MQILFMMIVASLVMALIFLGAFLWSLKSGQYEDDYTPSIRMLLDDKESKSKSKQ